MIKIENLRNSLVRIFSLYGSNRNENCTKKSSSEKKFVQKDFGGRLDASG